MTCKRADILQILKDNKVDLTPRSNLAKLVVLFSDDNVTVKQRQAMLNTVIASALQTRDNLLTDAFGKKIPKNHQIEFTPIEITATDIRSLLRRTRNAARNILDNTIGIGKPNNKSFLRDFVEASKRKLTEMFETSTTLREFMDTDSGKTFLEKATDQDKNALQFIITSSRNLNDWFFTGADGKPVLSSMNKATQFIFKKVGINGQTHTTKSGKKITPKDITDSFRYFLEGDIETGEFDVDPMVLEAINQAIYNWQSSLAAETFTNDDADINRIFGRDTRTQVKPHERKQFVHIGAVQATVIESIGKEAFRLLGLKAKQDVEGNFSNKLEVALGELAVAYMLDIGVLQQTSVPNSAFPRDAGDFGESQKTDGDGNRNTLFVKIKNRDRIITLMEERRGAVNLDEILGEDTFRTFPRIKVTESVPERLRRSRQLIPEKVKTVMRKLQRDPWQMKDSVIDGLFSLSEDLQNIILGINTNLDNAHVTQREKIEADNNRIRRSLENLQEFRDKVKTNSFFMKYFVSKTGRLFIDNNTIDPIQDKVIRHLIGLESYNVTVDSKEQRDQFKMAIAQAFGVSIDKRNITQVLTEFDAILARTEDAVAALKQGKLDEQGEALIREAIDDGEGLATYEALLALAQYDAANPFDTNIAIETDAVTSGVAIGMMQTLLDSTEDLSSVGVLLDGVSDSFPNWKSKTGNFDLYEKLTQLWASKIDSQANQAGNKLLYRAIGNIVGPFTNDKGVVNEIGRAYSKYPLMITNYGGSISSSVQGFSEEVLTKFYEQLAEARNKKEIDTIINRASRIVDSKVVYNHETDSVKEFTLSPQQEAEFKQTIIDTYGASLSTSLNERLGSFMEFRENINNAFQVMFAVFEAQFNRKVKAEIDRLGRTLSLVETEAIIDSLRKFAPIAKGPLSIGLADGIAAIKEDIRRQYTLEYKVQQQYARKLNNTIGTEASQGSASLTSYASTYQFGNPGVAGTVVNIHNLDSAIQQAMLSTVSALNIHDAGMYSLNDVVEGTQAYNKAFLELNLNFNLGEEVFNSFQGVRSQVAQLSAEERSDVVQNVAKVMKRVKLTVDGKKVDYTINQHLAQFNQMLRAIQVNKEALVEENPTITVSHSAHTPDSAHIEIKQKDLDTAEDLVEAVIEDLKGSSTRTIDFENFQAIFSDVIDASSIQTIFDTLISIGNKKDSTKHTARLQELIDNLIRLQGSINLNVGETDTETFGIQRTFDNDTKDIHILGSVSTIKNNAQLSAQEVYVHELLHAVTEYGIDTNTSVRNALKRLFNQAKKHFTWRDFLPEDRANLTTEEIQTAKETYDYIFNNANTKDNPYLHEFVAYGLSNENVAKKLATIPVRDNKKVPTTLFEQLQNWFLGLVDYMIDRITGVQGTTADIALRVLVTKLTSSNDRGKYTVLRHFEIFDGLNKRTIDAVNNFIFAPLARYRKNNNPTHVPGRILKTVSGILDSDNHKALGKVIKQVSKNIGITERSFIVKLVREMQGLTKDNAVWHSLLRMSKKVVDQARLHEADNVKRQLQRAFHTEPSKAESDAIYRAFMKTDLVALLDTHEKDKYSPEDIMNLLTEPDVLAQTISGIENQLIGKEYGQNAQYYIKQAEGLGKLMATGAGFVPGQLRNAFLIASLKNTDQAIRGDLRKAERLIDELATLYALQNTNKDARIAANTVYQRENAVDGLENGITALLNLHALNKEESLERLFGGEKALTVKGYTRETFNPNIDVKISTKGLVEKDGKMVKREDLLKEQGYIQVDPKALDKDPNDPSKEKRYLFVNRNSANADWVKSIVSLTSKKAQGTSIFEIFANLESDSTYDDAQDAVEKINKATAKQVAAQFKKGKSADTSLLLPIVNEKGEIVSYRYIMSEHVKDSILERDNRFDYAMGRMFGVITDKVNSKTVNSQVLNLAVDDFNESFAEDPSAFIDIGNSTKDPELKEIYDLLPQEMKAEMRKLWGKGKPIMIREEFVNLIFGFRKLSLKDKDNMMGAAIRGVNDSVTWIMKNSFFPDAPNADIGRLWTEVVNLAKELIVVKTGVIIIPNFISNNILLLVKGVSPSTLIKSQTEAVIELDKYHKDQIERDIIVRELAANKKLSATKRKKLEVQLGQLNNDLQNNPVGELIDEGIFQSIIEDVNFEEDIYTSRAKIGTKVETIANEYLPDFAVDAYRYLYLTKDTAPYQVLLKTVQMSDFIARYALYKHRIENRPAEVKTREQKETYRTDALAEIVESFVNYDVPTSREMQWINDVGLLMFTKFYFRIQKIILRQFKERPASTMGFYGVEELFGKMDDIGDTNILFGTVFNRANTPFDIIDQATDIPLVELVT